MPPVIFNEIIHNKQWIIVGKNTIITLIITKTPSPVFSKHILPWIVLYASDKAEPTIGINDDKVNLTALVEIESADVVIKVLKVSKPEKTVIAKPIIHFIILDISFIMPCILRSEEIAEVTETPKNTLNKGETIFYAI